MTQRRSFLKLLAASGALLPSCADGDETGEEGTTGQTGDEALQPGGDRLVFLGTQGGPAFAISRGESSTAVIVKDQPYIVDCGYGALRAMVQAEINYLTIGQVFLTHLHNDHCSDVASLIGHQWTRSRMEPTVVYGPYGTDALVSSAIAFGAANARIRAADEGRVLLPEDLFSGAVVTPSETPIKVYEDERVVVTSVENTHFPEETTMLIPDRSISYRFDSEERSVVITGDTTYTERLVELARDADILVCEGIDVVATRVAFDQQVANGAFGDNPEGVWDHIVGTHVPLEDAGRMATAANVKTLVINHLVPGGLNPNQTDQMYIDQITPTFAGQVVISADQMVL